MADIQRLVERRDFWDDLGVRQEILRQWFGAPRQVSQPEQEMAAPAGFVACPIPTLGRHVLQEGHMFGPDGSCWIPA